MVIAERNVRGKFAIQGAIALHLVLVAARIAVEEVAVVHPHVLVVLLQANVVAFIAVHVHDSEVADFHVLRVLDANSPAVHGRVGTDTFHRHVGGFRLAEVNHHVALHKRIRIRHVADKAQVERSRLVALLVAVQNALEALASCLCSLGACSHIHRHGVLGAFGNVEYHGAILERAVGLVRTGNAPIGKSKTAAVVRLHRKCLCRGRSALLAALHAHNLERVVARLEPRNVYAPGRAVLADKFRIDLNIALTITRVIHVVTIGAVRRPLGIGRFEPATGIAHHNLRICRSHHSQARKCHNQTFHTSIPYREHPGGHPCQMFSNILSKYNLFRIAIQ